MVRQINMRIRTNHNVNYALELQPINRIWEITYMEAEPMLSLDLGKLLRFLGRISG